MWNCFRRGGASGWRGQSLGGEGRGFPQWWLGDGVWRPLVPAACGGGLQTAGLQVWKHLGAIHQKTCTLTKHKWIHFYMLENDLKRSEDDLLLLVKKKFNYIILYIIYKLKSLGQGIWWIYCISIYESRFAKQQFSFVFFWYFYKLTFKFQIFELVSTLQTFSPPPGVKLRSSWMGRLARASVWSSWTTSTVRELRPPCWTVHTGSGGGLTAPTVRMSVFAAGGDPAKRLTKCQLSHLPQVRDEVQQGQHAYCFETGC